MKAIGVNDQKYPNIETTVQGVVAKFWLLLKRLVTEMSIDASPIFKSSDWPYLWPKLSPNIEREREKNGRLQMLKANEMLIMQEELSIRKARRKRSVKIISWGSVSLGMYLIIFLNQGVVTQYFTEGGWFAIVVVITALIFALVHGMFANYVLEGLNFKAVNRNKDGH